MSEANYVVGNWKMNLGQAQSVELAFQLLDVAKRSTSNVWIAPTTLCIPAVSERAKGTELKIGAQNAHWEGSGACTGENSIDTLKELGCSFAIIGHSERRNDF